MGEQEWPKCAVPAHSLLACLSQSAPTQLVEQENHIAQLHWPSHRLRAPVDPMHQAWLRKHRCKSYSCLSSCCFSGDGDGQWTKGAGDRSREAVLSWPGASCISCHGSGYFLHSWSMGWTRIKEAGDPSLATGQAPRITKGQTICDSILVAATRTLHHFKMLWVPILIRPAAWLSCSPPLLFQVLKTAVEGAYPLMAVLSLEKVWGRGRAPQPLGWGGI